MKTCMTDFLVVNKITNYFGHTVSQLGSKTTKLKGQCIDRLQSKQPITRLQDIFTTWQTPFEVNQRLHIDLTKPSVFVVDDWHL